MHKVRDKKMEHLQEDIKILDKWLYFQKYLNHALDSLKP